MAEHLPTMVRELIEHYTESKFKPSIDQFIRRSEFESSVHGKLNTTEFNKYVRKVQNDQTQTIKHLKTDQRIFQLEMAVAKTVTKEQFDYQMKLKASDEKMKEIAGYCIYPGQDIKDDSLKLHKAIFELLKNP